MVLAAHSDTSYLSETKARSWAGGHFFLSENDHYPHNNGSVLTIAQIIKAVMLSATEAELGALYINARELIPLRHLLIDMRPFPTTHANPNRQLHSPWRCQQYHPTQTNQGHGHALPLAPLPYKPTAFLPILASRGYQFSRLCHQTSPCHPSSNSPANFPYICTASKPDMENIS